MPKVIALTVGDAAGIGPEIIRKALRSIRLPRGIEILPIGLESAKSISPGKLSKASATLAWASLNESIRLWKAGKVHGIVTAPIHKENMASIGFSFPGHTEFFSHHCGVPDEKTVMAFYDRQYRVALVSAHEPLEKAVRSVQQSRIIATTKIFGAFLEKIDRRKPLLAMAGLNPHAGENGLFGNEEKKYILPAVLKLRKMGWQVTDPLSPDTLFCPSSWEKYDGIIAHYHDQGLIPFKMVAFDRGVNVTLGLPLVRTSPDHGTALNLAGKNRASAQSMIEAIQLAARLI